MFSKIFQKNNHDDNSEGLYNTTLISQNIKFTGDIEAEKNIRLDGYMEGNINCKGKVIIGKTGNLIGTIIAQEAEVYGTVTGKMKIFGLLELKEKANVEGEIFTNNIISEPSAKFNGTCQMINENENKFFKSEEDKNDFVEN